MKKQIIVLAIVTAAAAQVALAAPEPREIHQGAFRHIKAVRDAVVPAPIIRFVESFPPIAVPRKHILALAQTGVEPFEVQAPPPPAPDAPVDPTGIANWAEGFAVSTTQGVLDQLFPRGGSNARRPIIVGGDSKNIATLSEDLTVMMRILEKAAGTRTDGPPTASGIALLSFSQPNSPRAFYLDGYGAMFVLNVKFPLLAPPKSDGTDRTNDTTNSEWEKAKEEVYGRRSASEDFKLKMAQGEEFDPQRVESLKTQILNDLANAKNIRHLKSDDSVTVVVLGGGSRSGAVRRAGGGGGRGGRGGGAMAASVGDFHIEMAASGPDGGPQSTMTLRAKKADIDAFAKGKLTEEEFGKKVAVQVY